MDTTSNLLANLKESFTKIGKITSAIQSLNLPKWTFEETDRIIAKHGWFIPSFVEIKLVFTIMKLYEADKIAEAENSLVKYFKKNIKQIEAKLINQHSERKELIAEAFLAHRKKCSIHPQYCFYHKPMEFVIQ